MHGIFSFNIGSPPTPVIETANILKAPHGVSFAVEFNGTCRNVYKKAHTDMNYTQRHMLLSSSAQTQQFKAGALL